VPRFLLAAEQQFTPFQSALGLNVHQAGYGASRF